MSEETVEDISREPGIRAELSRTAKNGSREKVRAKGRDKVWFGTHLLLLAGAFVIHFLLNSGLLALAPRPTALAQNALRGGSFVILILGLSKAIAIYVVGRVSDPSTRFTLKRILNLVTTLALIVIAVSMLFKNWYATLTALGVGSIIIGLAIQTPMRSFIAWVFIVIRQPYRVGDRIKIGEATGDVIDVGYLDTTLWEFGGEFLSKDHPTGRVVRFPNEKVLDSIVWNYSWPVFPYVWDEIKFQIAYQSDLKFVAETMQRIVEEELGEEMLQRAEIYRELLARTPVDEVAVRARPRVIFRVDEATWLFAIVRYLAPPQEVGLIKNRLVPKLLETLNASQDRVMFPLGYSR